MKDLYEYSTPELVRMLGERFKEYRMRSIWLKKKCQNYPVLALQLYTSSRMVQLAIFHCQHSFFYWKWLDKSTI